jgi:hypothetical protein
VFFELGCTDSAFRLHEYKATEGYGEETEITKTCKACFFIKVLEKCLNELLQAEK